MPIRLSSSVIGVCAAILSGRPVALDAQHLATAAPVRLDGGERARDPGLLEQRAGLQREDLVIAVPQVLDELVRADARGVDDDVPAVLRRLGQYVVEADRGQRRV